MVKKVTYDFNQRKKAKTIMAYRLKKLTIRLPKQAKIPIRQQAEVARLLLKPYYRMVLMARVINLKKVKAL